MKRLGYLFEQIVTFENLLLAVRKTLRGKKDRPRVAEFFFHLEPELLRLEEELLRGTYTMRPYRTFMVYEPKPRKICAAERATMLAPVSQGIPFLGVRIFPGLIRLQRSGWTRFKRKLRERELAYVDGEINEQTFVQSVQSLLGHIRHANTYHLRRDFFQVPHSMG